MADVTNLGTGGSALDATYGAGAAAPKFLAWPGDNGGNYLYCPAAASGDNFMIPHAAGAQISDNLDLRLDLAADDWTPASDLYFAGKTTSLAAATTSWAIGLNTLNRTLFSVSDGATMVGHGPTFTLPFIDGQRGRMRFTYTRDTGAGQYALSSYYSLDFSAPLATSTAWTLIGTSTGASIGTMVDIATGVYVSGYRNTAPGVPGKYYGFALLDGTTQRIVVDTSTITTGAATSFTATTGQTVNINRATTAFRRVSAVTAPCWTLGADDYLEVPDTGDSLDFGPSDPFTIVAVVRQSSLSTSNVILAKRASTSGTPGTAGWLLRTGSGTASNAPFIIDDGTAAPAVNAVIATGLSVIAGVRDTASDRLIPYVNGVAGTPGEDTTTVTLANGEVMRVGRLSGAGAGYLNAEVLAAAVWRRALSADEIATLSAYFAARWP